jgi:hypothetical protein
LNSIQNIQSSIVALYRTIMLSQKLDGVQNHMCLWKKGVKGESIVRRLQK